jgi:hypothetical protein
MTTKSAKPAAKKAYTVSKKRSGRYIVQNRKGEVINGVEKTKILVQEGLVKTGLPKPKAAAEEAPKA